MILIYGCVLFSASVLSRVFSVFSNEILRLVYIFVGILSITYGTKKISSDTQNGLWFSVLSEQAQKNKEQIWGYSLWLLTVFVTLFTIINNTLVVYLDINLNLIIVVNCLFGLIAVSPGIWLGIEQGIKWNQERTKEKLSV